MARSRSPYLGVLPPFTPMTHIERGDKVEQLLRYVHFEPEAMLVAYRQKLERAGVAGMESSLLLRELQAGLRGYTCFED